MEIEVEAKDSQSQTMNARLATLEEEAKTAKQLQQELRGMAFAIFVWLTAVVCVEQSLVVQQIYVAPALPSAVDTLSSKLITWNTFSDPINERLLSEVVQALNACATVCTSVHMKCLNKTSLGAAFFWRRRSNLLLAFVRAFFFLRLE
jgi:hypothetical protein